jgi:hypothetical protein
MVRNLSDIEQSCDIRVTLTKDYFLKRKLWPNHAVVDC